MRITCVIGNLGGGGAERVMLYLCEGLAARGHAVTLLTLDNTIPDFYSVPAGITRVRIQLPSFKKAGFFGGFPRLWKMVFALRRTRPDVMISFMTVSILAASWLLQVPSIYADHLDISRFDPPLKWKILRNWLLKKAHAVTVLSERDRKFVSLYHPGWNPVVIYNPALPAVTDSLPRPSFLAENKKYVLAVGRLVKQKGFDRLLEAWRRVCDNFPDWRLCIIGGGQDETELKNLAEVLDVQHCVDFIPPVQGLAAVYQHADLYAMSSRTEGFPMVLLEAMAAGVPVVSFACTGPDVIVRNGVDGFLVKQNYTERLAEKMAELMRDDLMRAEFGKNAQEITQRFSLDKYICAYENLCKEAVR